MSAEDASVGSAGEAANDHRYVPITIPKVTVIQRTAPSSSLYTTIDSVRSLTNSYVSPSTSNASLQFTEGVNNLTERCSTEKKEMKELNEKLAAYIEKVRFLEAHNKKMAAELQRLRDAWGKETEKIKHMFESELQQLKKILSDTEDAKAKLEVRTASLEEHVQAQNATISEVEKQIVADLQVIDKQHQQISGLEAEVNLLRRKMQQVDETRIKRETEITRLKNEISRLRVDLDQETLAHIKAENMAQGMKEEIEFLRLQHEQELKEMANITSHDSIGENREFWKSEMSSALREIQELYDSKIDAIRTEMETQYSTKLREVRNVGNKDSLELIRTKDELKRLKAANDLLRSKQAALEPRLLMLERELEELRHQLEEKQRQFEIDASALKQENSNLYVQLESMLKELQQLTDAKIGLELEIAAYRKLLEVEDLRPQDTRRLVDDIITGHRDDKILQKSNNDVAAPRGAQITTTVTRTEMSAKVNVHRTAKGNVSIREASTEGKYVMLENTGKKDEVLDGWKLVRTVDNGAHSFSYVFDKFTLPKDGRNKSVKIWARGEKPETPETVNDLVSNNPTWGVGIVVVTALYNADGEERATHTQKTSYTVIGH